MAKEKSAGEKPALAPKQGPSVCFTIMPFGGWKDNYYDSLLS